MGYVFALSQFVMVWVLAKWYLSRADRVFDPLAEKAAAQGDRRRAPAPARSRRHATEGSG